MSTMRHDKKVYGLQKIIYWWVRLKGMGMTDFEIARAIARVLKDPHATEKVIINELDITFEVAAKPARELSAPDVSARKTVDRV